MTKIWYLSDCDVLINSCTPVWAWPSPQHVSVSIGCLVKPIYPARLVIHVYPAPLGFVPLQKLSSFITVRVPLNVLDDCDQETLFSVGGMSLLLKLRTLNYFTGCLEAQCVSRGFSSPYSSCEIHSYLHKDKVCFYVTIWPFWFIRICPCWYKVACLEI